MNVYFIISKKGLFALFFFLGFFVSAQKDTIAVDSLFENIQNELNVEIQNIELLDSAISDKNVVLFGENHSFYERNEITKYEAVTYLNKKIGVNKYLMEFGPTTGWVINEFVMDRDSSLETILNMMPNESYKNLFIKIRDYNRNQADSLKIEIIGVDAQKLATILVSYVNYLRRGRDIFLADDSIQLSLEAFQYDAGRISKYEPDFNQYHYYSRDRSNYDNSRTYTIEEFLLNYERFKKEYNSFFGIDSIKLADVLQTFKDYKSYEDYSSNSSAYLDIFREREMIKRLKDDIKANPNAKYFGQFGKCHIASIFGEEMCSRYSFKCFADRINEDSLFNLLRVGISYKFSDDVEYLNDSIKEEFKAVKQGEMKIVRYDKSDSLRTEPDYILIVKESDSKSDEKEAKGESSFIWVGTDLLHYNFNYEQGMLTLDKENAFTFDLSSTQSVKINSSLYTYGGSYKYIADWVYYFNISASVYGTKEIEVNDSLSLKFGGFQTITSMGYEFTPVSWVNISTYGGIGYGSASMKFDYDKKDNYLIGNNDFKIFNRYYLLDIGADMDFTLGFLNFGARAGYQYDISKKEWIGDVSSYKTSFSGFYWHAFVGATILIY